MLTKFLDWAAEPSDRSRRKRAKTPLELWFTGATVFVVALFGGQAALAGICEGYCWIWPGIGTRFAPGYSTWGFETVQPGMTKADVVRLIGPPLGVGVHLYDRPFGPTLERGDELWQYGTDSSGRGGDWAWLSREVAFRRGIVVEKVYWTFHD